MYLLLHLLQYSHSAGSRFFCCVLHGRAKTLITELLDTFIIMCMYTSILFVYFILSLFNYVLTLFEMDHDSK